MPGLGVLVGRLGLLVLTLVWHVNSFTHPLPTTVTTKQANNKASSWKNAESLVVGKDPTSTRTLLLGSSSTTSLHVWGAAAAAGAAGGSSSLLFPLPPIARLSLGFVVVATVLLNARRWLWPRAQADSSHSEPLPPGSLGCPFVGTPFFWGSKRWGAGSFYRTRVRKLENWPRLFKYYFLGTPFVAVSGYKRLQKVLGQEFEPQGLRSATLRDRPTSLMGQASIVAETDKRRHQFLRRLIGQALTPTAVGASVPVLQQAAQVQVDRLLASANNNNNNTTTSSQSVRMDRICTDYTLDVAWKQILGLRLADDEIPTFVQAVDHWVSGIASPRAILGWELEKTQAYRSFLYLQDKVNEKIDDLERNGPDGVSTLSGMVFAADDDVPVDDNDEAASGSDVPAVRRKLSRKQVVDNAMILILAGSETSASTLTNAMALLGLHPHVWDKLVDEQRVVRAKYGEALTKEVLDRDCPYLEAVIKESLRIRPISGGIPRLVTETIVVDGQQIPKGWVVDWSAALSHELDPKTFQPDGSHMDVKKGFVPERWLNEATTPVDFVPMGAGPRYCLGSHLAYTEMKVFLALLARNLDFDLASDKDNIRWKRMSIIPKIENGVPIVVRPLQSVAKPSTPVAA